jgi:disulfide oxidoreductase YuzD
VNEPTIIEEPTNDVKVVKNLADVKSIDNVYDPSISSSSLFSRPSFKQQIEQLKSKYNNKTIKYNYSDVVKNMNKKKYKTLKNKYN